MKKLLLFTLLAVAACSSGEESAESAPATTGPPPAKVEVTEIRDSSMTETRTFLGEVRNADSTTLAAGGSGTVTRLTVKEGDDVSRGTVLVQLDDSILRAQLEQERSNLERTKVELEQARRDAVRYKKLSEQGAASGVTAEEANLRESNLEATLRGQEASIRRVREEIAQMRIVAPVDGVIARRHAAPGQWLTTGSPAIELASDSALEVHVRVPSEVLDVLEGEPKVHVIRGQDRVAASVAGVVGSLDPRTRTALIRIIPANGETWLREGDAVDVDIALKRSVVGVVVPTDALVYGVSGARIFRVVDGAAEPHDVEVVTQTEGRALVKAAKLKVGDTIVRKGNERLRPGQPLQVGN